MPPPGVAGPSNFGTPAFTHPSPEFAGHFNMNFNFNDMASAFPTPDMSDDRRGSSSASSHSGLQLDGSSFDDAISPHELNFDGFDFNNFTFQQPSPNSAGPSSSNAALPHNFSVDSGFASSSLAPHTSPGAQLDQTFTSTHFYDDMNLDEGYAADFTAAPNGDFTLFGTTAAPSTTVGEMFSSLPAEGGSWGNFGGQFDANAPHLPVGNSALDELFPELKGH